MGRRIVTTQLQKNLAGSSVDTYFDRVIKYIPSDIVGAWVAAAGLIKSASDVPQATLFWIAFGVGIVLTCAWTIKQTSERGKAVAITQTVVSTGAFFVWAFALGEPFSTLEFYRPVYGSLVLILYTLIVGLVIPSES